MTRTITIHPAAKSDQKPYPFHIEPDGTVGRQDFWNGNPSRLVGFQHDTDVQQVDVDLDDFLANPESAVGCYPVFFGDQDGLYNLTTVIESVHVHTPAST